MRPDTGSAGAGDRLSGSGRHGRSRHLREQPRPRFVGRVTNPGITAFRRLRRTCWTRWQRPGRLPVGGVGADKAALNRCAIFRGRHEIVWINLRALLKGRDLSLNIPAAPRTTSSISPTPTTNWSTSWDEVRQARRLPSHPRHVVHGRPGSGRRSQPTTAPKTVSLLARPTIGIANDH